MIYSSEMTMGEARKIYFESNHFGDDGGYSDRWIKVKVWRIPIWVPNTKGRQRAVRLHDLHHILTEYPTTWRGEAEISAWEVAGGLRRHYAGWYLDLMNIGQGLFINRRGVYRAFMRGRRTENLFSLVFSDEMLSHRVGEFRRKLRLEEPPAAPSSVRDHAAFVFWAAIGALMYVTTWALTLLPLALLTAAIFWLRAG